MVGGGTPSKKNDAFWTGGDIPWVSPKDMSSREVWDAEDHITQAAVEGSATQVVPEGSVLVVVRSGILVRRVPVAIARVPVALNQDMKALLPGGPLEPDYLAYALEAQAEHVLAGCVKRGATVHSIDIGKFNHLQLAVPPPSEQHRIVEILDQADALRKKRAEADAKAARILPALFYKMFGDPATNPTGWDQKPFDLAFEDCTAQFPKLQRNAYQVTGRFPVVDQCKELVAGYCDDESLVTHVANPVIVFGDHTRIVKYVDFPFVAGADGSRVFAAKEGFLPAFLAMQLELQPIPNLGYSRHMREVRRLRFIAPPASLQRRYAERAESIRPLLKAQTSCRDNIESIWQTLLHHAFTGYLTAKWREAHMKELLAEMEHQAKALKIDDFRSPIEEDYKSSIINHQSEIPHD